MYADADRMLIDFVRERDVECPVCGYNVRDLVEVRCPECRHALELRVGASERDVFWFLATVVPGVFSGMAALVLLIPIGINFVNNAGRIPPWMIPTDCFGLASGLSALLLVLFRRRFLRLPIATQHNAARVTWVVHIGVFAFLLWVTIR